MPPPHHLAPFFFGLSVTLIVPGVQMALGRVPRNYFRTPAAGSGTGSKWDAGNRTGGKVMVAIGLLVLLVAIVLCFI